jgi:hypothetical protein
MNNIFNFNLHNPRNSYTVRQERIKREGSPYYTWIVPVTAAAAKSVIAVQEQFSESRKYEPLDWLEIVNNEAALDLTLLINNNDSLYVPASSMRTMTGRALWHIAVTNNGGANTTLNKIIVTLRREPQTIDKWAQRQK